MSEIIKSEYNALGEGNNYKTHYFKTSADQVVGLGRMKNTEYQVGDVVYSDTNNKVVLKCIQAGTTSNTELDISGKAVGESVADGSVVWEVIDRDYTKDYERIASRVQPIELGGTGGTTGFTARTNLKNQIMTFHSLSNAGISYDATVEEVHQALMILQTRENSWSQIAIENVTSIISSNLGLPQNTSGQLYIRNYNDRMVMEYVADDGVVWRSFRNGYGFLNWKKILTDDYLQIGNTERYSEGLQICRGQINIAKTQKEVITLNLPFANEGYRVFLQPTASDNEPANITGFARVIDSSSFEVSSNYSLYGFHWIAIGRWK